ncbi:MAG: DHA2 family efflux MFS transporter permease subunit [Alphaproteobacteria bacterium]|nr:DHA2 family efflux MFS transporter permease subunit [Alphaproteobacteria bacterium]
MSSIETLFDRYGPAYRWLATVTAMISAIAVVLSTTIVNVAIPGIMGAFGIGQIDAQWISTGFLAAMTATMLLADWADRAFGLRASMIAALATFAAGSVLGALAPNETVLTLARIVQGAATGVVQPLAMILMFRVFPPNRRGSAMGIFGVGVVIAPALGPWIGGVLIDAFNWRYVFVLGVPFAALAILLANFLLPGREQRGPRPGFDWPGLVLLCGFLGLVLSALSNGQRHGWSSDPILLQFALSGLAFAGFVGWELVTPKPILDMRLFSILPFAAASVVSFVLGAGLFGSLYLLPLFVQTIQGLTPTQAGLLLMPAGFVLVFIFPIGGRLSDRVPPGIPIAIGLTTFALATLPTYWIDVDTGFEMLALWTAVSRVGMGLIFPSLTTGSLRVLSRELLAQGSGAINFVRQLGGAFGVNLLAILLERRTMMHADAFTASQTAGNAATTHFLDRVVELVRAAGLPEFQQMPAALGYLGQVVAIQANTLAFRDGFLIVTAIFIAALAPTWVLYRATRDGPGAPAAR